jgi:hypothetical protein
MNKFLPAIITAFTMLLLGCSQNTSGLTMSYTKGNFVINSKYVPEYDKCLRGFVIYEVSSDGERKQILNYESANNSICYTIVQIPFHKIRKSPFYYEVHSDSVKSPRINYGKLELR